MFLFDKSYLAVALPMFEENKNALPFVEDERQIPCYHLNLPIPHDISLFDYVWHMPEILYLYNGRTRPGVPAKFRFPRATLACILGPYSRALHQPALLFRARQTMLATELQSETTLSQV